DDVVAGDATPGAIDVLIDIGPRLAKLAGGGVCDEAPARIDRHPIAAVEREHDRGGVGAGRDDEIVLEPAGPAVVHEVDAGIIVRSNRRIANLSLRSVASAK